MLLLAQYQGGYRIYYGSSEGLYSENIDVGNVTQYPISNVSLTEGVTCYFVVRAYNADGESGDSNVVSYVVPINVGSTVDPVAGDTTPPLNPQGVSCDLLNGGAVLTWGQNNETDISGYRVYYGTESGNYGLPIPVGGTEYTITGLNTGVTYYFAVKAIDTAGNESGFSSPEVIQTISTSDTGPVIKWDAAAGTVSGYRIYYGNSEGVYSENIDVGNVTQYSISNVSLTEGVTYYFVVRAYNADGESGDSNVVTYLIGETADTMAPMISISSPTTGIPYDTTASSVDISGTASDNSEVAGIDWSNSAGGSGTAVGTNSWSVTGLDIVEGANIITVTAIDAAGNKSTDTLTIVYTIPDVTAPIVTITSPTWSSNFSIESDIISIGGTASDEVGVTQILWSNDKVGSGTAVVSDNWTIADLPLVIGDNLITITATDAGGNSSSAELTVWYVIPDTTAPLVNIVLPTSGTSYATASDDVSVGGTASDAAGVTQVAGSNSKGGSGIAVGTENWSAEGISFLEGENVIIVTAKDEAGNTSTDSLTVVYTAPDTTPPVLTITSPVAVGVYETEAGAMEIIGEASDDKEMAEVVWSSSAGGSGTAVGLNNWSISGIQLVEGDNIFTLTGRDTSGNATTANITIRYTAPDLGMGIVKEWSVLTQDDFESGWGSFADGGGDVRRSSDDAAYAHQGTYCARIRDNSGTASSIFYINDINVDAPGYTQIKIDFWFYAVSMDKSEDFLVEYFDGSNWLIVEQYVHNVDFVNKTFYHKEGIIIEESDAFVFPENMKIRFRCDASGNRDYVYIDEVIVSAR